MDSGYPSCSLRFSEYGSLFRFYGQPFQLTRYNLGREDGLVAEWNKSEPAKAVKGGDLIIEVNGNGGIAQAMMNAVRIALRGFRSLRRGYKTYIINV